MSGRPRASTSPATAAAIALALGGTVALACTNHPGTTVGNMVVGAAGVSGTLGSAGNASVASAGANDTSGSGTAGTSTAAAGNAGIPAGGTGGGTAGAGGANAGGANPNAMAGAGTSGATNAGNGGDGGADVGGAGGEDALGGAGGAAGSSVGAGGAPVYPEGVDPKFLIFLLLGQSNMVGQQQPESQDREEDPRIRVLAYDNCPNVSREYNQWYTASPPLHQCDAGVGPGDYFAKTLLETLPEDYTIGLVPLAVNGAPIDVFRKGVPRPGWTLPPDNHWETGYEWIVSRANEAQKVGVIRGLLFHQGESNMNAPEWPGQVAQLVTDLRTDLAIGDVPFLAGELYYDGCCAAHNALVEELTSSVTNGFLISADGLTGFDTFHFDLAGQRELGRRYGMAMQGALTLP